MWLLHSVYLELLSYELVILKSLNSTPLKQNAFGKSRVLPVDLAEQKLIHVQNQFRRYDCKDYQVTITIKEGLIGPAI